MLLILATGCSLNQEYRKTEKPNQEEQNLFQSQKTQEKFLTAKEAYGELATEAHKWQTEAVAYMLETGDNQQDTKVDFTDDGKSSS